MRTLVVEQATKMWGRGRNARLGLQASSFTVEPGEVVGVVGPNGAGKSTLLAVIAGEACLTSGTVRIEQVPAGMPAARRLTGYAGDPTILPPELTAFEWLTYVASHRAHSPGERLRLIRWALELAEAHSYADRRIATFSKGMAQRVALAAAALAGSRLLVLDEILGGVDPLVQRQLRIRIRELSVAGRAVLVASHDLTALERLATRVLVLVGGRIVDDVTTASLLQRRVAEISLSGDVAQTSGPLLTRFAKAERTENGFAVPLTRGLTMEAVLAACHDERVPVAQSRIRYDTLEHILVRAVRDGGSNAETLPGRPDRDRAR